MTLKSKNLDNNLLDFAQKVKNNARFKESSFVSVRYRKKDFFFVLRQELLKSFDFNRLRHKIDVLSGHGLDRKAVVYNLAAIEGVLDVCERVHHFFFNVVDLDFLPLARNHGSYRNRYGSYGFCFHIKDLEDSPGLVGVRSDCWFYLHSIVSYDKYVSDKSLIVVESKSVVDFGG